ncbi:MAG: hypothetical protein C0622_01645 [Desulfuromonas sp.]|nr:MAG: hypothetical protein C0622_01645 [Desulfuromonas sp.]
MSKFVKVLITLLVIAGFVAPAVSFADDRLSLSGYYTLRAFLKDNADYSDSGNDSQEYFYQRLRLGAKIAVAEGVAVNLRADIGEGNLPEGANDGVNEFDLDHAYVTIDKGDFALKAGQYGLGFGNAILMDRTTDLSIALTYKPANLTLAYAKLEEGSATVADDTDMYMVTLGHSGDNYNASLAVGYVNNMSDNNPMPVYGEDIGWIVDAVYFDDFNWWNWEADDFTAEYDVEYDWEGYTVEDIWFVGLAGDFDFGAAKLAYEIDYMSGDVAWTEAWATFDGNFRPSAGDSYDYETGTADAEGFNVYLNGSFGVSETATLGAIFTYAMGSDDDEIQLVDVAANDFSPENWGFMGTLYTVYSASGADTFDPSGDDAGVVGIQPYVDFKVSNDIALHAHIAYVQPEDSGKTNLDNIWTYAASARYNFAPNTTIDVAASYSDADGKCEWDSADANTTYAARLTVSF